MKYTFEIMKEYEDAFKGISVYSVSDDKKLMVDFVALEELEDAQKEINEAYQRGLDDAWEAARKIVEMADPPYWGVFNEYKNDLFGKISAAEAIAKLKAYEEKQKADDKIKVGDEVIYNGTTKCIVVRPEDDERYASLIDSDGTHYSADHRECKKTGRHFDIASILEDMRND